MKDGEIHLQIQNKCFQKQDYQYKNTLQKILVVGINPSTKQNSKSIKRLNDWIGQLDVIYYSFINCIDSPGKYTVKDINYDFVEQACHGYDKILALGSLPSSALTKLNIKHFMLPHPSGLNRLLNNPSYIINELSKCKRYLKC